MDLQTVKTQLRAMKLKVRNARANADSTQLQQFKSSVARLGRKMRVLSPKVAKPKES